MLNDELFVPAADGVPRVITRSAARALGMNDAMIDHRLHAHRWRRLLPHTYLTVDTLTWTDRLRAAVEFAGPMAVVSGAAALAQELRCVPQPASVLVLVPYDTAPRSTAWVRIRRTENLPPPRRASGPRLAPVARAVADLALETPRLDDVRAMVTEAVRRRLCTVNELDEARRRGPRRDSKRLRQAIEEAADGAWSAPEARAGRLLRESDAPPFEQNARLELECRVYFADFLWRERRAILEIDSIEHHDLLARDRDHTDERHAVLERHGYSVLHFTPSFVYRQPGLFVDRVLAWLAARAPSR